MQANHNFLSPMHQSMVHVEIVLISKHQFYLQLPDGSVWERLITVLGEKEYWSSKGTKKDLQNQLLPCRGT